MLLQHRHKSFNHQFNLKTKYDKYQNTYKSRYKLHQFIIHHTYTYIEIEKIATKQIHAKKRYRYTQSVYNLNYYKNTNHKTIIHTLNQFTLCSKLN